ncbi:hypothetical protein GSI_06489 [Ganoderma sinense ZZ0214-1]|uniref:Uncharacterized protein n=1 Tax=Ganoderma sinense ZZ0214-1 TaxID=1077348 RepID=A0A2G8SDD5_9APHY|nr:hypothetical protein GSI_06489 [Ganoderma sinense ZZ0214-1]
MRIGASGAAYVCSSSCSCDRWRLTYWAAARRMWGERGCEAGSVQSRTVARWHSLSMIRVKGRTSACAVIISVAVVRMAPVISNMASLWTRLSLLTAPTEPRLRRAPSGLVMGVINVSTA